MNISLLDNGEIDAKLILDYQFLELENRLFVHFMDGTVDSFIRIASI